jgi:hypothetical protein
MPFSLEGAHEQPRGSRRDRPENDLEGDIQCH